MDETVTHYITSHPADQTVHVDGNALALNVQDDGGGRVAIMHSQTYSTSLCRQVSVGDQVVEGQWSDEMIDPEGRLAALMAHITAQQSRGQQQLHHKVHTVRGDVDTSIILDSSMRLFHGQPMDQSQEPIVVEVPPLPPLPPLQEMKRCQETDWFNKNKQSLKDDSSMIDSDGSVLELGPGASPGQHKLQSKKSLPHKKRISRKLKKNNGNCTPQQEIVVISCRDEEGRISCASHGTEQEILPDNFVQQDHMPDETHHIEVRPIFICQLCGEFYGDEQLKFFQHLKQHYEPHIIIENPVQDLGMDKITNSCIVDNVTTIPDSIVELSLENSIPKTIYQSMDKHVLYTTSDKTFTYANNKLQYSMASMDKEPTTVVQEAEKADLYDTLDKLDLYSCGKCNKSFRKQKQCEAHIKEAHSNMKLEDMGEFSEPEDLMEGIHVAVDEPPEHYEHSLLPHLTVENGHAHQDNVRHWYSRGAAGAGGASCGAACCTTAPHDTHHLKLLKDEVLRRILETDVASDSQNFTDNTMTDPGDTADTADTPDLPPDEPATDDKSDDKKKPKKFECQQCNRVFQHRNSLLYHMLSHSGKQQMCRECGKGFYTVAALKIHKRVHNGDRPYKCDVCGRDFRQWSDLKYHKVSIHSDQKMFKCEFCGKEFARKYSLNVHRRIHTGERNYKCEYCNKTFRASSYRLSHMRTHTGDRPHKCVQCDKCFRVAGDLRRHMLTHDKVRNRLAEHKTLKLKDHKEDKKPTVKQEDHPNIKVEVSKNIKKIALASTTKSPNILRTVLTTDRKKPNKKNQSVKKGAPNVTIDQIDDSYTNNVEVFDTRQDSYGKLNIAKKMYSDPNYKQELENPFTKQIITAYKDEQTQETDFAILRPMFRNNGLCDTVEPDQTVFRTENTDGKMQVYTHIEKNNTIVPNSQVSLNDMRHLDREVRNDIHGETTENGFIERLTALYNIPAV